LTVGKKLKSYLRAKKFDFVGEKLFGSIIGDHAWEFFFVKDFNLKSRKNCYKILMIFFIFPLNVYFSLPKTTHQTFFKNRQQFFSNNHPIIAFIAKRTRRWKKKFSWKSFYRNLSGAFVENDFHPHKSSCVYGSTQ
jgi:hypothetical protein